MDKDVILISNGILLTHKRNRTGSFIVMWVDLESVIQSKASQKEKNKYHMLNHFSHV